MKLKSGKKKDTPPFSHIASAIIPSVGILAVPAACLYFPRQKTTSSEPWGPIAPILIRAASASELLVPSSTITVSQQERDYQRSRQEPSAGRIDASTDDDEESDEENEQQTHQKSSYAPYAQSHASRSGQISNAEKRMLGYAVDDDDISVESISGTMGAGSSLPKDPKEALTAELSRSASKNEERSARRTGLTAGRQQVPPLVFDPVMSHAGPTSTRAASRSEALGGEARSITTARSSLNESTTIPMSARSVSFKEPVVYETYDPPSSQSQATTTVRAANGNSALEKLVLPPPEEYQHNFNELERRNQSLTVELQQWRSNHRTLQRQYEQLLDRLQTSQNLSKQELTDLLRQSGMEQTRELGNLNGTLQDRCDQLESELSALRERDSQNQNSSSVRELKNENHFLKDYIHRLNAASSEYQALNPPKVLKKEQRRMQGLPVKGPSPIWLLNRKFLAPLFLCYDEKLHDRETFIKTLQTELRDLHEQMRSITDENMMLHQRLSRSTSSPADGAHLSDLEHIKRQAYLVLEENKVLQKQLDLQNSQLTDVQKKQINEVSTLTRRLLVVESEKTEGDRILETIRIRNEDLRRKYDQLMMDNTHRIHVQEHIYEMSELKRLTDELSERHAHEMQLLLRRVQDGEAGKKLAQLKLAECRSDLERFKGDLKAMKKLNRKLHLRVQTFEKKLELQQVKEQHITTMLGKTSEEYEQTKLERDTFLALAKTKEEEMIQIRTRMTDDAEKLIQVEERLENYKSKNKERVNDVQEQMKRQHENVKLRCLEHEQRIQQLMTLLNEKQTLVNDLNIEKRNLQVDLETIWQSTNADNLRIREQLLDMRAAI